jgi:hypothetical protein
VSEVVGEGDVTRLVPQRNECLLRDARGRRRRPSRVEGLTDQQGRDRDDDQGAGERCGHRSMTTWLAWFIRRARAVPSQSRIVRIEQSTP